VSESEVTIRRAPRIGTFLVVGAMVGLLGTLIATSLFPADENVGFAASFAYFCLYGIPAGVVLFAIPALILDWRSRRRARTVTATRDEITEE
jgi:hypothetical protein